MATALAPSTFLAAIKGERVTVVEVDDWRTHNRNHMGPWGPVHGVMIHHTVTKGTASTVRICRDGYAGLPGPLCHGVIAKDGRVHLVGYGRANHAGSGDDDVLRAVIAETDLPPDNEANTDGNPHFYGFECENLGDGVDLWPEAQIEAIARTAAGICRKHGWGAESVIGHSEWQPGKIDPRGPIGKKDGPALTMAKIRARVAQLLDDDTAPDPVEPKPPTPAPSYEPFPGASWFTMGRRSPRVLAMRKRLIAVGCNRYQSSADPDVIGSGDKASYEAWQRKCGHTGDAATWPPGKSTWDKLRVPNV